MKGPQPEDAGPEGEGSQQNIQPNDSEDILHDRSEERGEVLASLQEDLQINIEVEARGATVATEYLYQERCLSASLHPQCHQRPLRMMLLHHSRLII